MTDIYSILIPMLNANEEQVHLIEWLVNHGDLVEKGDSLCEVETSKASTELTAEQSGIIFQITPPSTQVKVGSRIGLIGPTMNEVEEFLNSEQTAVMGSFITKGLTESPGATPKAEELAASSGVSLIEVASIGIKGTIKEADVKRYISERQVSDEAERSLSSVVVEYVVDDGAISRHDLSVVNSLTQSAARVLAASVEAELDLSIINSRIHSAQKQGTMLSLMHLVIRAIGRCLPEYNRLMSFHYNHRIYRYKQADVAFVTRTTDGQLYTPVVRNAAQLTPEDIARSCHALTTQVNRGRIKPQELQGGCFTISHLSVPYLKRFVALPNLYQSAILALSGNQTRLKLEDGQVTESPSATMTLTYDHALCDGMYAAEFLRSLIIDMESDL